MHHLYFSGTPAVHMSLGAFFSAAEVIPLTFLTVEAWTFLQFGARQQVGPAPSQFPHRWAVLYLASVGFWNFLGAGVFGFLINLPVVSYYEIGTQLTANHGHAAMMGVYGMLAIALMVFCLRYLLREEDWSERLVKFSFWALNLGLAWMVFANLFPVGVLQLADVVTNGYWHARSLEFFEKHAYIEWLRLPGDMLFIAGVAPLVYLTGKAVLRPAPRVAAPTAGAPPSKVRCLPRRRKLRRPRGCGSRSPCMFPLVALFALPADAELWIVLGYVTALTAGAWCVERLARMHFERARRHGHAGFDYIEGEDHFRCAGGERLLLHVIDEPSRLAVYRAPLLAAMAVP